MCHSFNKYLLSMCSVPGPALGARNIAVNLTELGEGERGLLLCILQMKSQILRG